MTRRQSFVSFKEVAYVALLLLGFLLASCGGGGGASSTGTAVIPTNTKVLDNGILQQLEAVTDNGSTLVFSGASGVLAKLSVGDVIVAGVSAKTPNGLLRKVTQTATSGGNFVVSTEQATLEEAIETGTLSVSQTLSPSEMFPGRPLISGVVPKSKVSFPAYFDGDIPPLASVSLGEFYFQLNNVILYDADGNNNTTGDQVATNGEIRFNPSFDLEFSIENHKLKTLLFKETTQVTSNLGLSVSSSLASINKSTPIWESVPQVFTFMAGPIPVVITAKIQIIVGVNGQVSAGISTSVTDVASITGGLQYNNGNWGLISDFTNDFSFNPPSAYLTASLKGFVGPRLDLMLYAVAGPYAEIDGNLLCKGEINPTNSNLLDMSLYGGIEGNVGVQIEIFSRVLAGYSAKVFDYSKKLWENSINLSPFPGSISVNPASGSWTSTPQNLAVSSSNSTIIYYTMVNTYDGTTPADPREPTSSDYDGSIAVPGGAGTFQLYATAGQNKQSKLRFRGYNSAGAGPASGVYTYSINLSSGPAPGNISVGPTSGNWTTSPQNIAVSSSGATAIYYTMVNTTDGSIPEDPREPTSSDNDGSVPVSGGAGTFQLYATTEQNKQSKLRFRGYNSAGAGPASGVYIYSINNNSCGYVAPRSEIGETRYEYGPSLAYSPVDIWVVGYDNPTAIYFTMVNTYDGSTPADPRVPTSSDNDGSVRDLCWECLGPDAATGKLDIYADVGQYKRMKVRLRAYNCAGAGPVSQVYSFTFNMRDLPRDVSVNPSSGSWTSNPQNNGQIEVRGYLATKIYYTMVNTYDGSTPTDPRVPTSSNNDGYIGTYVYDFDPDTYTQSLYFHGWFKLVASPGQYKRSKLRFLPYNSVGAGPVSGVYSYSVDLR